MEATPLHQVPKALYALTPDSLSKLISPLLTVLQTNRSSLRSWLVQVYSYLKTSVTEGLCWEFSFQSCPRKSLIIMVQYHLLKEALAVPLSKDACPCHIP